MDEMVKLKALVGKAAKLLNFENREQRFWMDLRVSILSKYDNAFDVLAVFNKQK
jgi:hypothetical protein